MERIALITEDGYFFRKCALLLEGLAELTKTEDGASVIARTEYEDNERRLVISRGESRRILPLPARFEDIVSAFTADARAKRLFASADGRGVFLDGALIKLTESEGALIALLISGGGEFISRERILDEIFPGKSSGMINVYVHYLREKLEKNGEKIIIASRDAGYRIDARVLGGEG